MSREDLEDLPRRWPDDEDDRWHRRGRADRHCERRIVRRLRQLVGRPWGEVEAELDRLCRGLHEDGDVISRVRRWIRARLSDGHPYFWSGVRAADGRLWVEQDTGVLRFTSLGTPAPRYVTASELRREPEVFRKGKKARR